MSIITDTARAYVNHGRWIADCPREHCRNAMALEPRQKLFQCGGTGGCQMMSPIDWPDETDAIWSELTKRPVPVTRNWYPEDHPIAINAGIPHGQSVSDLAIETAKHMGE